MAVAKPPPDDRYRLAYQAATDLTAGQRSILDNLRQRATTLLSATTVTTTFGSAVGLLGTGSKPLSTWVLYVLLLIVAAVGACAFYILLPANWTFGFNAETLIDDYIESAAPSSLDGMYRDMAIYLHSHFNANEQRMTRLFWVFRLGVVGLTAEVVVLLVGFITR